MINTSKIGSFIKDDKAEHLFQQYIKLEHEDRDMFMNKVTRWLINKAEGNIKIKIEQSN